MHDLGARAVINSSYKTKKRCLGAFSSREAAANAVKCYMKRDQNGEYVPYVHAQMPGACLTDVEMGSSRISALYGFGAKKADSRGFSASAITHDPTRAPAASHTHEMLSPLNAEPRLLEPTGALNWTSPESGLNNLRLEQQQKQAQPPPDEWRPLLKIGVDGTLDPSDILFSPWGTWEFDHLYLKNT